MVNTFDRDGDLCTQCGLEIHHYALRCPLTATLDVAFVEAAGYATPGGKAQSEAEKAILASWAAFEAKITEQMVHGARSPRIITW